MAAIGEVPFDQAVKHAHVACLIWSREIKRWFDVPVDGCVDRKPLLANPRLLRGSSCLYTFSLDELRNGVFRRWLTELLNCQPECLRQPVYVATPL